MALLALCMMPALAQEVSVDVRPVQPILPPKAGDYIDDPGNFFTLRVTNNTDEQQRLFFGCHINMEFPDQESYVVTNYGHIPRQPIVLEPRQSKLLNRVEMKQLFTYLDQNDVYMRDGLWDQFNGAGLLPEGQFTMSMQCYKWDPELTQAVQLNEPSNGTCQFQVCYLAQPPTFITPQPMVGLDADDALGQLSVANLDIHAPTIAWTMPTLKCNPSSYPFQYDVRIVRLDGEMPDVAIETHAVEYQNLRLTTPTLTIPTAYVTKMKEQLQADGQPAIYAMQVTASNPFANSDLDKLHYSLIENEGRSPIMLFRLYDPTAVDDSVDISAETEEGDFEGDKDSLYVFEQPTLTSPIFSGLALRKMFIGDSIRAGFRKAWHVGGRGEQADTVQFKYTMQLFKGRSSDSKEVTMSTQKPFFEHSFVPKKGSDEELKDSAKWEKLKDKVKAGDYVVMRIKAEPLDKKLSLRMKGDSLNVVDFAMAEHFSDLFQCAGGEAPTNKTDIEDMPEKGTVLSIGAYDMTIDEIERVGKGSKAYKGKGHVDWNPMGLKAKLAVKFDSIWINTDKAVYNGRCYTYARDEEYQVTNAEAIDMLFSDWGLDNILGDTALPDADELQEALSGDGKELAQSLAEKLDVQQYYKYYKLGMTTFEDIKNLQLTDVHMPIQIPKEYNTSPVDLQIASMTFAPTTAYANVLGIFELPENNYTNQYLIFGAPHLCMEPDKLIPESGTVALLGNATLTDPKTQFEFTFKAPDNIDSPADGCFLRWMDSKFSKLHVEIEMQIPELMRADNDKAYADAKPVIRLEGDIEDWKNWWLMGTMDPFQHPDLPGWTFVPGEMGYDHSSRENLPFFKMPDDYDCSKAKTGIEGLSNKGEGLQKWQGFSFKNMGIRYPKVIKFDDEKDMDDYSKEGGGTTKAISTMIDYMLIDAKFSASFSVNKIFDGSTTSCGGWGISIDRTECVITQNKFHHAGISGKFQVPLLKQKNKKGEEEPAKISYQASMFLQDKAEGKGRSPVWVFATTQEADISLDFWAAVATFDKKQTYFLVESDDDSTKVELCLGGQLDILKNSGLKVSLPGIKFTRMRLANCPRWKSKYLKTAADYYATLKDNKNADQETLANAFSAMLSAKDVDKDDIAIDGGEIKNENGTVRFDIGRWSFASPEKKVGSFDFTIRDVTIDPMSAEIMALKFTGDLKLLSGKIKAATTLGIGAKVDWNDLGNISYHKFYFYGAEASGDFGGMKVGGSFEVDNPEDPKGYMASLDFTVPGDLFKFHAAGGWGEKDKTDAERAKDQKGKGYEAWLSGDPSRGYNGMSYAERKADREQRLKEVGDDEYERAVIEAEAAADVYGSPTYTWCYLAVSVKSSSGIPAPPIQITGIKGGFYWNAKNNSGDLAFTDAAGDKGDPAYGMVGGLLGVSVSTIGSERAINGDMQLTVFYDMASERLSTISLVGTIHALCAKDPNDGLINAKAKIVYSCNDQDKYFDLDITAEGGVDLKDELRELAGDCSAVLDDFAEQTGLGAFAPDENDPNRSSDTPNEAPVSKGKADGDDGFSASCGFKVSLNFRITWKRKGETFKNAKWHLYIGRPPHEQRCELRLIDFAVGKRDDSFALWCSIGANAYLCLGNELVDENGKEYELPALPKRIAEFLGLPDINGNDQSLAGEAEAERRKTFTPPTNTNSVGGFMLGASEWGDFGINAGIVYARAFLMAGFDVALKKLAEGTRCIGGKPMGSKNGYYAMGQVYAMAEGEIGLMINCWLFKGKIPLISVGIGALLKGGLPNPTWIYGKMKARYKLLGGLIKGSTTVELKLGEVCVPEFGNPLDDIKIFEEMDPGYEDDPANGWLEDNAVSVLTSPRFTTNMVMDDHLRLVDYNEAYKMADWDEELEQYAKQASRTYVFHLDPEMLMETFDNPDPEANKADLKATEKFFIPYTTKNHMAYSLGTGTLGLNKGYRITLKGYAKEIVNGKEIDPIFNDSTTNWKDQSKQWRDSVVYYFRSSSEPPQIKDAVAIFHMDYQADLERPMLAMKYSYASQINDPNKPLRGRLEYWDEHYGMWLCPDIETTYTYVSYIDGSIKPDNVDIYGRLIDPATGELIPEEDTTDAGSTGGDGTNYTRGDANNTNSNGTTPTKQGAESTIDLGEAHTIGTTDTTGSTGSTGKKRGITVGSSDDSETTSTGRGVDLTSTGVIVTNADDSSGDGLPRVSGNVMGLGGTNSSSNDDEGLTVYNASLLATNNQIAQPNFDVDLHDVDLLNHSNEYVPGTHGTRPTYGGGGGGGGSSSSSYLTKYYYETKALSKPNSESKFFNMPLEEVGDGDLIFIRTVDRIDRQYLVPGRKYRFSLCEIDMSAYNNVKDKVDSVFNERKRAASGNMTASGNAGQQSTQSYDTPEDQPTVNLADYMDDILAEVEKELGEDADTTRHIKLQERLDLANYSHTVYSQLSNEWKGFDSEYGWGGDESKMTFEYRTLQEGSWYNDCVERGDLANRNRSMSSEESDDYGHQWYAAYRPHTYAMLKSINRTAFANTAMANSYIVNQGYHMKDAYLNMGYWAKWAMVGGYMIKNSFFSNDNNTYIKSGEGIKIGLNDNGNEYSTAIRKYYNRSGSLNDSETTLSGGIEDFGKDMALDMGYSTSSDKRYGPKFRDLTMCQAAVFSNLLGDARLVAEFYNKLDELKADFEKYMTSADAYADKEIYEKYYASRNISTFTKLVHLDFRQLFAQSWWNTYANVGATVRFAFRTNGYSLDRYWWDYCVDSISFPYYQIPLMYSYTQPYSGGTQSYGSYKVYFNKDKTGRIPAWRLNTQNAQAVWDGIKPMTVSEAKETLCKNIQSVDFEIYRQNCYHTGRGYTEDNRYGCTTRYDMPGMIVPKRIEVAGKDIPTLIPGNFSLVNSEGYVIY